MIILQLVGGLGNQLFMLAFAESLLQINQNDLYLDISSYANYTDRQYDLDCFELDYPFAKATHLRRFYPAFGFREKLEKGLLSMMYGKGFFLKEKKSKRYRFDADVLKTYQEDVFIQGYWQSYRYFADNEQVIRKLFRFKKPLKPQNEALGKQIKQQGLISLHVRRGDYVQDATVQAIYGTCSLEYYQKAINYLAERVENPQFLIFSDDIAWCKKELETGFNQFFVDENNPNYEDLHLMSLCKHHILANSSFSWWGAWLNDSPDKIVIAPKQWLADPTFSPEDLIPPTWIQF